MYFGNIGENFPYTNFHDLNLDWILQIIKTLDAKLDRAITAKIKVADPLQWDISKQYEEFTIVMNDGNAYLSMKPVPAGVNISNTDYWQQVFNLDEIFNSLKESIAYSDDGESISSSINRTTGSLVWLNNTLYKITEDMSAGDIYTDTNHEQVSIEELLETISSGVDTLAEQISIINSTITELQNSTLNNRLYGKQLAIYGDSYSAAPRGTAWQTVLNAMTGTTAHVSAQGALSLPEIYSTCWDNFDADIYIIEAGLNDVSKNTTAKIFIQTIIDFVTSIRLVNSNAEIYFVSPNNIPFNGHSYLYPYEFYRQCYWHLMSRYKFGVIDGLKWQGLVYPDDVHPSDATAPLIGKYIFESLLNYGDSVNFCNDYSKMTRNNNQILFIMEEGRPYLFFQNLAVPNIGSDGSAVVDISQLGLYVEQCRIAVTLKSGSNYYPGFIEISGFASTEYPTKLTVGFQGQTQGSTVTIPNGYKIQATPNAWIQGFSF